MSITPQGIILIIFGLFICLSGYSIFRSMLPLWGFILGGLVAITVAPGLFPQQEHTLVFQIIAFVVGGVVGALISAPLYYVAVFLTGAALGALTGAILGSYLEVSTGTVSMKALTTLAAMPFPPEVDSTLQLLLMVVLGLLTGGLAIGFQKFMITASTAFIGSAAIVAGANQGALEILRNNPGRAVWIIFGWFVFSMIGLFVQYRMRDET
jgi:hypothetical protein